MPAGPTDETPSASPARAYSFVTIAFEAEREFLALQARSLRLYCPPDLVGAILVVENSGSPPPLEWKAGLLAEYAHLADRVRIVNAAALCTMPPAPGWWRQQVLKLVAGLHVPGDRYIALDAKTHLAFRLGRALLETGDGRARMQAHAYHRHPMRAELERVFVHLGADLPAHVDRLPQTSVPFIAFTEVVRRLIGEVGGTPQGLARAMIRHRLTEFFLYSAFLAKHGELDARYAFHDIAPPVIWPHMRREERWRPVLAAVSERDAPFLSVHRRAMLYSHAGARAALADFWVERHLFPSREAALAAMSRIRGATLLSETRWHATRWLWRARGF